MTHNKVCHNVVTEVPPALARFLGDTSGLAEFVDDKVKVYTKIFPEHDVPGDVLQTHRLLEIGSEKQHLVEVCLLTREFTSTFLKAS